MRNMTTSLALQPLQPLVPLVPLGVRVGVRFVRRVSPVVFYRVLNVGMLLTGVKLLWDGLR